MENQLAIKIYLIILTDIELKILKFSGVLKNIFQQTRYLFAKRKKKLVTNERSTNNDICIIDDIPVHTSLRTELGHKRPYMRIQCLLLQTASLL